MSTANASGFTNVGQAPWYQRGLFASQTTYVAAAFVVIVLIMIGMSPNFLKIGNLYNVAQNFSYIAIVALGVTLVIVTGGIDLSVGSVMAVSAIVMAIVFNTLAATPLNGVPGLVLAGAVLAGLVTGVICGLVNGVLIARVGLSPFVTTLGMLSIARGLCFILTEGRGQIPAGNDAPLLTAVTKGQILGVPMPLIYLVTLALIMAVTLKHTRFGRYVFAIGGNEKAAALTGIEVERIKISVYVLCSLSAAFAGILMGGWLGSVPANLATGYELRIIAASVIGGANLAGGAGGPVGAILGAALIEVIRNGLVLGRVSPYWQDAFVGLIIILAVLVDRLRARQRV